MKHSSGAFEQSQNGSTNAAGNHGLPITLNAVRVARTGIGRCGLSHARMEHRGIAAQLRDNPTLPRTKLLTCVAFH